MEHSQRYIFITKWHSQDANECNILLIWNWQKSSLNELFNISSSSSFPNRLYIAILSNAGMHFSNCLLKFTLSWSKFNNEKPHILNKISDSMKTY